MFRKSLLKSESAAAIAIAAVLLLGLTFTLISVVKLNYAPEWKINAEKDYSYDAWSNMEDVKTRADLFTRFMDSNINYPEGLSATVPFSMGGGDVPVFEPSKSNSKLAVNTEECIMNIAFRTHSFNETCGGVTYYSENKQYPDQVFRYENGALILAQGENSQMKRDPSFNIKENMGNYTVTINAINLTGEPESISSSTFTALRLTGCSIDPVLNTDVYTEAEGAIDSFNLSISTHYTDAWTTYLNNTAKDAGLEYGVNYTINSTDDYVHLSFLPTGNNYSIYANKTVLGAKLGTRSSMDIGETSNSEPDEDEDESKMELGKWYFFDTFTGTYKGLAISSDEANPEILKDYDESYSLPAGDSVVLSSSYIPGSYFRKNIERNGEVLKLNFGFNNFSSIDSTSYPINATIRMIYRWSGNEPITKKLTFAETWNGELNLQNTQYWRLYNKTVQIYPGNPENLTLNIEIKTGQGNGAEGNFDIDYLTVRLD